MDARGRSSVVIDWSVLERVVGSNAALRERVLAAFLAESERDLTNFEAALDAQAFDTARSVAHRLSGAARVVGAMSLADLARSLEQGESYADVAQVRSQLREHLALVHARIRSDES